MLRRYWFPLAATIAILWFGPSSDDARPVQTAKIVSPSPSVVPSPVPAPASAVRDDAAQAALALWVGAEQLVDTVRVSQ